MPQTQIEDMDDDDGGITGWEKGDADRQLVPGGGVTLDDEALSRIGQKALVVGLVLLVIYMMVQYSGG